LGRPDFVIDPGLLRRGQRESGYTELVITSRHAAATASLPRLHRDPFDRMLVAQCLAEEIMLLTSDPMVGQYPGPIRLV
jgi:PIN domain nuclease of toxin-antitoxin system